MQIDKATYQIYLVFLEYTPYHCTIPYTVDLHVNRVQYRAEICKNHAFQNRVTPTLTDSGRLLKIIRLSKPREVES